MHTAIACQQNNRTFKQNQTQQWIWCHCRH